MSSYTAEMVAEDLLTAALGLQFTDETEGLPVPDAVPADELSEAGIGYRIVGGAEDEKEDNLREVGGRWLETTEDFTDTDCPWWTMTGDDPVVVSEATQADAIRSAGGWSDIEPPKTEYDAVRATFSEDVETGTTDKYTTWGEWKAYVGTSAAARKERTVRIFDWLRAVNNREHLVVEWRKFWNRVNAGTAAYKASGRDSTKLYLTKGQVTALNRYRLMVLNRLEKRG